MLRSLKDLERYDVSANDGDVGRVVNFLLDDERWAIRYLVVDTGVFFRSRRVLVSPISFRQADWLTHRFHLALTIASIEGSPSVDADKPVCRQKRTRPGAPLRLSVLLGLPRPLGPGTIT
jgi:hypothetical protein